MDRGRLWESRVLASMTSVVAGVTGEGTLPQV